MIIPPLADALPLIEAANVPTPGKPLYSSIFDSC
jgi:hypothetical protein